jgi:hypothetical protein
MCHPSHLLSPWFIFPTVCHPHSLSSLQFVVLEVCRPRNSLSQRFVVPAVRCPCHLSSLCHPHCLLSPLSLPFVVPMAGFCHPLLPMFVVPPFIIGCSWSWVPLSSAPPYPSTSSGSQTGWGCCVASAVVVTVQERPVATLQAEARSGSVGCWRWLWLSWSRNRPFATLRAEARSGSAELHGLPVWLACVCRSAGRQCRYQI